MADIKEQVESVKEDRRYTAGSIVTAKIKCSACAGEGYIMILQEGEERYARCPCLAGEKYNGWPTAPSWAVQSDRSILHGQEVEIPF